MLRAAITGDDRGGSPLPREERRGRREGAVLVEARGTARHDTTWHDGTTNRRSFLARARPGNETKRNETKRNETNQTLGELWRAVARLCRIERIKRNKRNKRQKQPTGNKKRL